MQYKAYGHWSEDGREYVITHRKTPRNWYNYLYNDYYMAFVSQVGNGDGFLQDTFTNRAKLITDRCVYITDKQNRTWHTAAGLPIYAAYDHYECRHGLGYTTYVWEKDGIRGEFTVYVPLEGDYEQWIVTVKNLRHTAAQLGVIGYTATDVDGVYEKQGYNSMEGHHDTQTDALYHRFSAGKFRTGKQGVHYSYMLCDAPVAAFDCRHNAFIGTYGHKDAPEALIEHGGCRNSDCVTEKLCFALEAACCLQPGEEKSFRYQIGYAPEKEDIAAKRQCLAPGVPERLLKQVKEHRSAQIDGVTIHTPDEMLNNAFNSFYKYATVMGSHWARVRHNGYRDMTNDTDALAVFNPELAWQRLKRILAWQYSSGYAPRTIQNGAIQDNNFADCAVWMSMAAHTIVMELGQPELLLEEVPFNDGTKATVFEHLRRAIEYLFHFTGENGLIKIWGGDWNDGMNWAGLDGKGVSVWLSIAWYRANNCFMALAELLGEQQLVRKHAQMGQAMRERVERYGWDGRYYLAAINDDGVKIGSQESEFAKMWLNPQTWAVMAGIAPKDKLEAIMQEVDSYLECPYGTKLNRPAFTQWDSRIGNFTRQPQGVLLNESVYLQPMAWKLTADCMLGRREQLQASLYKMLPWNHTYGETQGEPYIFYNFYATEKAGYRAGIPGQSWRTATAQCFIKAMVQHVFGLMPTPEGLHVVPCLPPAWKKCSIEKQFRGSSYHIHYCQGGNGSVRRIEVNGAPISGSLLPWKPGTHYQVVVFC